MIEVRCLGMGNVKERSYIIFCSGGEYRIVGVGFIIFNKFGNINLVFVNERLMIVWVLFNIDVYFILISVYVFMCSDC